MAKKEHEKHKPKADKKSGMESGKKPEYAGGPKQVEEDAEDDKEDFACGGKPKRKEGGKMMGEAGKKRLDKPHRASGGRTSHSPFTSASKIVNKASE